MKCTVFINVAGKSLKSFATVEGAGDFIRAVKWLYHQLGKKPTFLSELYISRTLCFFELYVRYFFEIAYNIPYFREIQYFFNLRLV